MSLAEWPWVTELPWNELPPRCPGCKVALTEAPLCRGVEPTCSGAEVTGGTLTGHPLFSGTGGGVQGEEMLGRGCRTLLPRRLLLPGSSSEQDEELQGVHTRGSATCSQATKVLRLSPCSPASPRAATRSKPGQAPASRSPQVWPLAPSRISLLLPCTFWSLRMSSPLSFASQTITQDQRPVSVEFSFLPPLCIPCTYYCPY